MGMGRAAGADGSLSLFLLGVRLCTVPGEPPICKLCEAVKAILILILQLLCTSLLYLIAHHDCIIVTASTTAGVSNFPTTHRRCHTRTGTAVRWSPSFSDLSTSSPSPAERLLPSSENDKGLCVLRSLGPLQTLSSPASITVRPFPCPRTRRVTCSLWSLSATPARPNMVLSPRRLRMLHNCFISPKAINDISDLFCCPTWPAFQVMLKRNPRPREGPLLVGAVRPPKL